ncbi:MAG: formylglycine-generating enzyme family protein [Lentisphaeria bacterium]|nr:formylglycine-generating enzyme family protein [Lentisphaeria bacterium]
MAGVCQRFVGVACGLVLMGAVAAEEVAWGRDRKGKDYPAMCTQAGSAERAAVKEVALAPPVGPVPGATAGPVSGQPWSVPDLGMAFVEVPAGSFRMGSTDGRSDEKPVHEVRITRPFWLGKYEVTQGEYEQLIGSNSSKLKGARNPVEHVPWILAEAFCRKLTERERAAGRLPVGYVYRLPTEAEWEYAARGGAAGRDTQYSGSDNLADVGWYRDNSGRMTHPVGGKQPNELGLCDMSGNVWEWCLDGYDLYPSGSVSDPVVPMKAPRCLHRGGSWSNGPTDCRVARRDRSAPTSGVNTIGFRVALAPILH